MDHNETCGVYTTKDMGKDIVVAAAQSAIAVAGAWTILLSTGYVYMKLQDRKAKKTQTEN